MGYVYVMCLGIRCCDGDMGGTKGEVNLLLAIILHSILYRIHRETVP